MEVTAPHQVEAEVTGAHVVELVEYALQLVDADVLVAQDVS